MKKAKSRLKNGKFTQEVQRWKIATFALGITTIGPIIHLTSTHQALIPSVSVVEAKVAGNASSPIGTGDQISDPLFYEIRNDPVKYYIYMDFSQISTKVAREALEVAKQESGFRPNAKNPNSTATGIFQIISGTWKNFHCTGSRTDYHDNIDCAVKIYKHSPKWGDWVAQPVRI